MNHSSPVLPNNKMTKSYLLESDPFLKTSSKTSPFALNAAENESAAVGGHAGSWNSERAAAAAAAAATIQQQFQRQQRRLQEHSIPGEDLFADRPTAKPLAAMHNVHSNVPPIAFINGNSVRPYRCRHYSQQQTAISVQQQQLAQYTHALNNNTRNCKNSMSDSMESSSSASSSSSMDNEEMMEHDGQNGSSGPVRYSAGNVTGGERKGRSVQFADGQMNTSSSSSSSSSSTTNQQESGVNEDQGKEGRSSSPKSRQSSSWFSLWSSTSSPPSSSAASYSQRDYVTNKESKCKCYDDIHRVVVSPFY